MILSLALSAALPLFVSAQPQPPEDSTVDARIVKTQGDVLVYYHDAPEEAVAAEEEDPLEAGDRVQTGLKSRAEVGLDGESVIELGANSDFEVTSLAPADQKFAMSVGSFVAKIKSLISGRMSVLTPTAVAAVRGTEFGVDVDEDNRTHVGVFDEGRVAVQNERGEGEQLLEANHETSVGSGERPGRPSALRRFVQRRRHILRMRKRLTALRGRWRTMAREERVNLRRLARARFNKASPQRRAMLKRRIDGIRAHRLKLQQKREKLRQALKNGQGRLRQAIENKKNGAPKAIERKQGGPGLKGKLKKRLLNRNK